MKFESFLFNARIDGRKRNFGKIEWKDGDYSVANYDLKVRLKQDLELELSRKDGKEMDLCDVSYEIELPLLNYGRVIVPDCGRFYMDHYLPRQVWGETFELTDRNFGNPFMALLDNYDKVELALGLLGELMETKVEKFIWDIFGWKHPIVIHTGFFSIQGIKLSKSKGAKEVKSGEYIGWNDPAGFRCLVDCCANNCIFNLSWGILRASAMPKSAPSWAFIALYAPLPVRTKSRQA